MEFFEKDLEQIIWESNDDMLIERGLNIKGKRFRQLKIGNYGIADLITVDRQVNFKGFWDGRLNITVYELKKDKIGISAFLQAIKYCKGISRFLENRNFYDYTLSIKLIGKTIDLDGGLIYLPDLLHIDTDTNDCNGCITNVNFFTYTYKIDGLYFNEESCYSLIEEGF